jgi:hypothetical protein
MSEDENKAIIHRLEAALNKEIGWMRTAGPQPSGASSLLCLFKRVARTTVTQ